MQSERPVYERLAQLLTSGLTGPRLLAELRAGFGSATREDVFAGIVMAIGLYELDLLIASCEEDLAKRERLDAVKRLMAETHKLDVTA